MADTRVIDIDGVDDAHPMNPGNPMNVDALAGASAHALDMDEDEFALFYQRTARPLWAYLSRVSRDRQQADDLLQETYYRFLRSRRTFDSDEHRRHYLFRIATNLLLDRRRRPAVETASLPQDHEADVAAIAVHAGQGARAELTSALAQLTSRERALLWRAYAQGASHQEIAEQTGLTSGSVKQLLFRARRRLAAVLGGGR